jgi:mgtE-like transporter
MKSTRSYRDRLLLPGIWLRRLVRALVGVPVFAVRGTARVVADPARQVVGYWGVERATIRQGFAANFISALTSLISGLVLAGMGDRLLETKGLFILIPVSIGMRGNIFGALASRLGTAIHSGLFEVTREKQGTLYQNAYSAIVLTFATSVIMGLLARGIAGLLGIDTISALDFVAIAVVGGVFSSAIVLAFTVFLSIASFRRGWDLDSVGAVLVTVIGDVVTLPSIFLASFLYGLPIVTTVIGLTSIAIAVFAVARAWRSGYVLARRIVRESFFVLCIAIVLDILAGSVVEPRVEHVFVPFPAFLIFLPGLLENTGALGSILAARLGTKLHLGAASPRARPDAPALLDGTIVLLLGLFLYLVTSVTTLITAELTGARHPGAFLFLASTMTAGLIAMVLAALIGYYAAIITFRMGLDPDNHTTPLVTSGMDLLGAICLVVSIAAFGIG